MNEIYIADSEGRRTNYDIATARRLWSEGGISRQSLYWCEGMPEWRPAGEFFDGSQRAEAGGVPPSISAARPRGFVKDPAKLTRFLVGLLWTYLGISALSASVSAVALFTGHAADASSENLTTYDIIGLIIGLPHLVVVITTGVIFLMWIHRANRNARGLGAEGMTFTPGWSVGWFFVPFANLWKPLQAMKEIWQASMDPTDWRSQKVPSLVSNWWALWVFSNILSNISLRLSFRASTSGAMMASEVVGLISEFVDIALCVVAIRMVRELIRVQNGWAVQPAQLACGLCRQPMEQADSIFLNQTWICARCKPVMLQRLQEGAGAG